MSQSPTRLQNPAAILRNQNFAPVGNGICLAVTATSGAVQFPDVPAGRPANDVLLVNAGSNAVFIAFGMSSPTAVAPTAGNPANGICILPGAIMVIDKASQNWIAAITASSTSTLYAYQGYGA